MFEALMIITIITNTGVTSQQIEFKPMAEQTAIEHCNDVAKQVVKSISNWVSFMNQFMMFFTKPNNKKRKVIIGMMSFGLWVFALRTRLSYKYSFFNSSV